MTMIGCECGAAVHEGPHEAALSDAEHVEPCAHLRALARQLGKAPPCICNTCDPAPFYSTLGFGPVLSPDDFTHAIEVVSARAGTPIVPGFEIDPEWLARRFGPGVLSRSGAEKLTAQGVASAAGRRARFAESGGRRSPGGSPMIPVLCFEVRNGRVRPCQFMGPQRMIEPPRAPPSFGPPRRLSRNERRRLARQGRKGRAPGRRVPPFKIWFDPPTFTKEIAHEFQHSSRIVYLYLPEGVEPSQEHGRALDRALHEEAENERAKFRIAFNLDPPGNVRTITVSPYLAPGTETAITTGGGNVVKLAPGESVEIAPFSRAGRS